MDNLTRSSIFQNIKHILDEQFFPFPSNCAHPTIISYLVVSIVFISRLLVYNIAYYYYITTQVVYTLFLFSLLFQLLVAGMQKLDYSSTRGLAKCHGIWLDILQVIMLPCSQESFFCENQHDYYIKQKVVYSFPPLFWHFCSRNIRRKGF